MTLHADLPKDIFLVKHPQAGQGRRTTELVTGIAVAMKKRLELGVLPEERLEDLCGRQRGGQRQVTGCQALGQRHEIRRHVFLFAGKHRSRPAEPGHDLIGDQQRAALVADLSQFRQQAARPQSHPCRSLDQRFDTDRCGTFIDG